MVRVAAIDAPPATEARRLGFLAGELLIPDDFDRMGENELEQLFGGGE